MAKGGKAKVDDAKVDDRGVPELEEGELEREVERPVERPSDVSYASPDAMMVSSDLPTEDVYLPGQDIWVKIQGMQRAEGIKVSEAKGSTDRECKMITWSMIEPMLTYQQVEQWHRKAVSGDVQILLEAITEVSGMGEDARKQAGKRFPEESGA